MRIKPHLACAILVAINAALALMASCKHTEPSSVVNEASTPAPTATATLASNATATQTTSSPNLSTNDVPEHTGACDSMCTGITRDFHGTEGSEEAKQWAACFSCRCKTALGRLLPKEELKCSSATGPLVRYRARTDTTGKVTGVDVIDANGTDTSGCLNGGIGAAGCDLQSRFRRWELEDGLEFQLLCRKPTVESDGFYEYLLIGHNTNNGATCFWQGSNDRFNGEDVAEIDLTGAKDTPANREAYAKTFYLKSAGPSNCTSCHSNDAFIWSPYFHSAWPMSEVLENDAVLERINPERKYKLVVANDRKMQDVQADVISDDGLIERRCSGCHIVTNGQYCSFAKQATGSNLQHHGLPQDSAFEHARKYLFWMPPGSGASAIHAANAELERICN